MLPLGGGGSHMRFLLVTFAWFPDMDRCWRSNDGYQVTSRIIFTEWGKVEHAAVQLIDDDAFLSSNGERDIPWAVKQQIKNEIFGEKRLAIEVFPKQKNLVDVQDVYHLWVFPKDFDLPFGIHPIRDRQCRVIRRGCPKDVGYLIENTRQMSSTVSDRERRNQADTEVFDGQRVSHPQEKET